MGVPYGYSSELPLRCNKLIQDLWPEVNKVHIGDGLGPLTTTFLLAMATPMIVLPIERIANKDDKENSYVDDSLLDADLSDKFIRTYKLKNLSQANFFEENSWRFAKWDRVEKPFNIAKDFPKGLSENLLSESASNDAGNMPVSEWAACLRNAISHGGIAFLNEQGFQVRGERTTTLAFVSGKYERDKLCRNRLIGIKVLKISEIAFKNFLNLWVDWLQKNKLHEPIAA
jgi:hypothetical protein